MEAELTAPLFKKPALLRYIEKLQDHLSRHGVVGKTSSAVDALKKASYELNYVAPPSDATEAEQVALEKRNLTNFAVPDSVSAVGQVFTQLEGMKKKDSLFHLVTKDYREANVWVQLKSGDNKDMEDVVADVRTYMAKNPPPMKLNADWAGLTYLNVVWQEKMVRGMLSALGSSFVVVLVMMMVLFRSPLYGVLSMIPLSVTIAFIYGLIGLVGKDYDMPVAVLSALTLGLSIDFAIHFLQRAREMQKDVGNWKAASAQMFKEPAMAISRNAIVISIGFTPLLMAPLVPYRTVGFFLATIMAVSWCATLFILPALVTMLRKFLFKTERGNES
jgi:predicted RND superfamily exporter protein